MKLAKSIFLIALMINRAALFILICLIPASISSTGGKDFNGSWELVPQKSTVIPLYRSLVIDFKITENDVTVVQKWGTRLRDAFSDTVHLSTDGKKVQVPLQHQVAPTNVFLGIMNLTGGRREMSASWNSDGTVLTIQERVAVISSQGKSEVNAAHT